MMERPSTKGPQNGSRNWEILAHEFQRYADDLERQLTEARACVKALAGYAQHGHCLKLLGGSVNTKGAGSCNCGLDDALEAARKVGIV